MLSDDDGDDSDGKLLNQTQMNDFFSTKRKEVWYFTGTRTEEVE